MSGQASIDNNMESITIDKCNREGVTCTCGYRHTASPQRVTSGTLMRIVQLSEDGRVSAVFLERSDDLDPPALGEFVKLSEDGHVSVVCPDDWSTRIRMRLRSLSNSQRTAASRWFCRNDRTNWVLVRTFQSID